MATDDSFRQMRSLFYQGAKGLLVLAVKMDRPDIVEWLLQQGINPKETDRRGRNALFFAKRPSMARLLEGKGVCIDHQDDRGFTALHAAIAQGRLDVALVLAKAGAPVDARSHKRGLTALHVAAAKGRERAIAQLLEDGANPNALDKRGRHPLFYAVSAGHLDAATALIMAGADLEVLDEKGTPWIALAKMEHVVALEQASQAAIEQQIQSLPIESCQGGGGESYGFGM